MKKPNDLSIIILAAGKGTRMKSSLPKAMQKVAGIEMVNLVIKAASKLNPKNITLVISEDLVSSKEDIKKNHPSLAINFAVQNERLGTANAVVTGLNSIAKIAKNTLILYADAPLITAATLEKMLDQILTQDLCILAFDCFEDNNYGHLITDKNNQLKSIVEYKDANLEQRKIALCNSGIIAIKSNHLKNLLPKISNNNAAKEYYLTDIIFLAGKNNLKCGFIKTNQEEVLGVNSMLELSKIEAIKQDQLRKKFMDLGVKLIDPKSVYFCDDSEIANDVIIHPQVIFGPQVRISSFVEIKSFCHIEGVEIAKNAVIGPFARIRPGSKIGENAKIGNFVEIKKSKVGKGSKIGHLSYIGDTELGKNSNIGASTITCNYDGYNKFVTKIGDDVFIGSHATLIAPVEIADNSVIGAGSVITKDVDKNSLAVSRTKQTNIADGGKSYHLRKSRLKNDSKK
jgi:bifunctional UDP-N-acetylglucosamine pyrophosphorylase/glucosamine-1-phosphate N-acetyltransferase